MTDIGKFLLEKRIEKLSPNEDYSLIHQLSSDSFSSRYSSNGEPELEIRDMTAEEIEFSQVPTFAKN